MSDIESLRKRYTALNESRPSSKQFIDSIESELGVQLPKDFREIAEFFDGGGINVMPLYSLAGNAPNLNPIHETLRLRKAIGLPSNWVVLGEPPASLLLMDCDTGGRIIWIDATDAERIGSQDFARQPDTWNSFSEFFDYLLDEEEADR